MLAVAAHVLPGELGLTPLVPEGTGTEDKQQDCEHFTHRGLLPGCDPWRLATRHGGGSPTSSGRGEQATDGLAQGVAALGVAQPGQHIIAQGRQGHQLGKYLIEELGRLQGQLFQEQAEQAGILQVGPEPAGDGQQQGRARLGLQQVSSLLVRMLLPLQEASARHR